MGAEPNENDGDACQYHLGDSYRSLMIKEEDFNRSSQATCIHFNTGCYHQHLTFSPFKLIILKPEVHVAVIAEPLLWDTSIQEAPPFRGPKIWS